VALLTWLKAVGANSGAERAVKEGAYFNLPTQPPGVRPEGVAHVRLDRPGKIVRSTNVGEDMPFHSIFTARQPLLLLDVDGVLIPYAAPGPPAGFLPYTLLGEVVWLAPAHGTWLRPFCDHFQVVWATGWEHDANRLIAPLLGLPPLPVIAFPRDAAGRFTKFPTIQRLVAEQPLVWIDDELTAAVHRWGDRRRTPTLLLDADPAIGLTREMVAIIWAFAGRAPREHG
jgi:hypothetical protein